MAGSTADDGVDFFQGRFPRLTSSLALGIAGAAKEIAAASLPDVHRPAANLACLLDGNRLQIGRLRGRGGAQLFAELRLQFLGDRRRAAALGVVQAAEESAAPPLLDPHRAAALLALDLDLDRVDG